MALYDNNDLLAVLGGQNLGIQTPYNTLQNYQNHGQQLLNAPMPTTMYSPWQAVAYALQKFEGRNEQDSAQNTIQNTIDTGLTGKDQIIDSVKGYNPPLPNLQQTGSIDPSSVSGTMQPDAYGNTLIQIESGGDPRASNGHNRGLGQFGPSEEKKYGLNNENWTDPGAQAAAITAERQDINKGLTSALGRAPTDGEAYLAHQQGLAGATALLSNPNEPAWKAIRPYYKSDDIAKKAIYGNIPDGNPLKDTPIDQISAQQFSNMWTSRFAQGETRKYPQQAQAEASPQNEPQQPQHPNQVAENLTTGSVGSQGYAPVNGQPAVTQQHGIEQLLSNLSHGTPPAEPPVSAHEAMILSRMPPEVQKTYMEQRHSAFAPETFDTGYGTFWKLPGRAGQPAQVGFIPKTTISNTEIQGVGKIPTAVGMGPDGQLRSQYLIPGVSGPGGQSSGPGGQEGAPNNGGNAPPINNGGGGPSSPTPANPNIQNRAPSGPLPQQILDIQNQAQANQRNNEIKTKLDTDRAVKLNKSFEDLQDTLPKNDNLLQNLRTEKGILNDPNFFSGSLEKPIFDYNKLLDTFGLGTQAIHDRSEGMQLYSKERADTLINNLEAFRGLGAIRNSEFSVLQDASGVLANTPGTLRALNEIAIKTAQRNIDVAQEARKYAQDHGGYLDNGWYDHVAQWREQHPLFSNDEIKNYHDLFKTSQKLKTEKANSNYNVGDTANVNGHNYTYQQDGKWHLVK